MIDLLEGRFFKTFIAVMEEKSFNRASEKLGYVQSTVTNHIQLLERACGQKLFYRLSRGVKPTEAGLKLAKFAHQFVHLGLTLEEAMNESNQPKGTIHLSMHESFFVTRMASLIEKFRLDYPMVRFKLETGYHQDVIDDVSQYVVDFGIVPRDPGRDDVIFYPMLQEELIFIASHELTEKVETDGLNVLNHEAVISFGNSCLYHTHANMILEETGVETSGAIQYPSIEMIKKAVKCGIGFALIPKIAAEKELEQGDFQSLPLPTGIFSTHGIIVNKDRELNFPAQMFKSFVLDSYPNEIISEA
ncbi:LysR family transcriptional regulator [Paenibacillus chondroitinus]|uniref:LysR family transcriptional regulator n=1 Tax=Paenibacillus chondroitinus TaxID=59842 RepID=A0ABU6DG76_9BACL|nr:MULTISPECIES: LysR family transcriptional regulator [Paenibacillus]MCY9659294.1 LysR family transcriptional regulator [Paenibacillus anseongense]MEB4796370.1 LysR family transcriptional regulator [Paenibacillus chondroitinus]